MTSRTYYGLRALKRSKPFKILLALAVIIYIFDISGVLIIIRTKNYDSGFDYPYNGDITKSVLQLRNNEKPDVDPINRFNATFLKTSDEKCRDSFGAFIKPRIVYLIKSKPEHFKRRLAIRNSWGYQKRFSDVIIRTVFLLGTFNDEDLQKEIDRESINFLDIVQSKFQDDYFNNTLKTLSGFHWVVQHCPKAQFYMFVDDDYYVSTKNVLRFIRNPMHYPQYLIDFFAPKSLRRRSVSYINRTSQNLEYFNKTEVSMVTRENIREKRQMEYDLPSDVRFYAGKIVRSAPLRQRFSKWFIDLHEYPYDKWPPYITAGAYILSKEALFDLYYASFYTKLFRFDDIYLAFVALKANVDLFNSDEMYMDKKSYDQFTAYKYVIASHGYENSEELLRVWNEQRSLNNA